MKKGYANMLKMVILSSCMVMAPFLQADYNSAYDSRDAPHSSIYVFSDYKGILYIDGKIAGRLRALSEKPFEISGLNPSDHLLQQQAPDGETINFDVQSKENQIVYVYLRLDGPRIGQTLAELNYRPRGQSWVYWLVGAGVISVAAIVTGVVILATYLVKNPTTNQNPAL